MNTVSVKKLDRNIEFNTIFIPFWIMCYIALVSIDLGAFSSTLDIDSQLIIEIARGETAGLEGKSYYNTGVFFSLFPVGMLQPFILVTGSIALIMLLRKLKHPITLSIAAYISIPCIMFILARPQKETIVMLLTMAVILLFQSRHSTGIKILFSCLFYSAYAYFFREYYFLIIAIFLCILVFLNSHPLLKIALVIFFLAVLLMVPESMFLQLQGTRDIINYHRIGSGEAGNRTAFLNPMESNNLFGFTVNYFYAALYLNFAFFFDPGIKEFFMLTIIFCYLYFIIKGLKSENKVNLLCSSLLLSHIIIYMLFEPDLGSYLRHLSSEILYLVPSFMLLDKKRFGHA